MVDPAQPNAKVFSSSSSPYSRGRSWTIERPLLLPLRRYVDLSCDAADPARRETSLDLLSWFSLHGRRVSPAAAANDGKSQQNFFAVYLDDFNQAESWCTSRSWPLRQRVPRLPPSMSLSELENPEATRQGSYEAKQNWGSRISRIRNHRPYFAPANTCLPAHRFAVSHHRPRLNRWRTVKSTGHQSLGLDLPGGVAGSPQASAQANG